MKPVPGMQRGMVLIVSLLILMLINVLAATVYETNLMQLQMAGNEQAESQAQQRALALVDAVLARDENIPLRGGIGHRICAVGDRHEACDEQAIVIPDRLLAGAGAVEYFVTRRGPLELPLPTMAEDRASSGRHYRVALFEVSASYDGVAQGQARAAVVQGVMIRLPVAGALNEGSQQ